MFKNRRKKEMEFVNRAFMTSQSCKVYQISGQIWSNFSCYCIVNIWNFSLPNDRYIVVDFILIRLEVSRTGNFSPQFIQYCHCGGKIREIRKNQKIDERFTKDNFQHIFITRVNILTKPPSRF